MLLQDEPWISVGILSEQQIKIELYGEFKIYNQSGVINGRFKAEIKDDKVCLCGEGTEYSADEELIVEPTEPVSESFLIRDVTIGVKFHWERKEKQRFNYILKLLKTGDKVTAINVLPLEAYLVSVTSSEMSAKSSLHLLKALSIISRSWLLAQIEKSKTLKTQDYNYSSVYEGENELVKWYDREEHKLYDVCADDHCQRFQGVTKVTTEAARKAVRETNGIVLLSNSRICDTRYSKSCGGITEAFENVWEPVKTSYLTSVIDYKFEPENFNIDFSLEANTRRWIKGNPPAFCNTQDGKILSQILLDYDQETKDFYRWKVEYSQKEISDLIKEKSGMDFGDILDLKPVERGYSARLIKLEVVGTKKSLTIGKELEIRRILSKTHLYSSAIWIEKETAQSGIPSKFIIYGAGWGHGVGMCQIGAAVMAEKGFKFDEILMHYFKDASLKKIY